MQTKLQKVALLGDINIDIFLNVSSYPPPGGDAMADQMELRTGGSAANTAIVLARLGLRTEMLTHIGRDAWAEMALSTLRAEGVGLDHLARESGVGTGLIFLPVTADGERTMFSYRGANTRLRADEISAHGLAEADLLHVSGYALLQSPQKDAARKAMELAAERGLPVSLDLGVEPAAVLGDKLHKLPGSLDLLVLGEQEARVVTGKAEVEAAIESLLEAGVKTIGLKLGREGCLLVTPDKRARMPGFPVETIDTTGAGDAFCAALIYGRLHGLSLEARGLLANAIGALATTAWGGGAALPSLEAVRALLRQQGGNVWAAEALASLETAGRHPREAIQ